MIASGHRYIKPIGRTTAPTRLLAVAVESVPASARSRSDVSYERGRAVWSAFSTRAGGSWSASGQPVRRELPEFWQYVRELLRPKKRLYVVGLHALRFLTVGQFWREVDKRRFALGRRVVLQSKPCIVDAFTPGGSLLVCGVGNWLEVSLADMIEAVNQRQGRRVLLPPPSLPDLAPTDDECTAVQLFMQSLLSDWVGSDRGPWRETAGQLALSHWRHSHYTQKVCRHADPDATELERAASHGGRASCWYYGDVGWRLAIPPEGEPPPPASGYGSLPTRAHRLDVRSQYPSILSEKPFPVRLVQVRDSMTVGQLADCLKHRCVIATVEIQTDKPLYPLREPERTVYPVGRFVTTLAGPELTHAIASGHVNAVYRSAVYDPGRPFQRFASELLSLRSSSRADGDHCSELFAKATANAFGGKFAQCRDRWTVRPNVTPPQRWGEWFRHEGDSDRLTRWRAIGGLAFERVSSDQGGKLLGAVYCYLTAYGRVQMDSYRAAIGCGEIVSQHTDGIVVSDAGLSAAEKLRGFGSGTAGTLRKVESCTYSRFYSANHFYWSGSWTLAGYAAGFRVTDDGSVWETQEVNPVTGSPRRAPELVAVVRRCKAAVSIESADPIGPDGWARPTYRGPNVDRTPVD